MAAPVRKRFCKVFNQFITYSRLQQQSRTTQWINHSTFPPGQGPDTSTDANSAGSGRDPGPMFIDPMVQNILRNITHINVDKVFRERLTPTVLPKYKLVTDQELKTLQEETLVKAKDRLQMPPVLKARQDQLQVLSDDEELADFDKFNHVFTDITYGLLHRSRAIVIREPSGRLRMADGKERDRILQIYYPQEGKRYKVPSLFEEENLERLLVEGWHEYVLDRSCIQFEPDDPEYIRITHRVYEHIASQNNFDQLRSTRHFGGMAFYFAFYKHIEGLLVDMIQQDLLSDACDLVRLYHIIHPECQSAQKAKQKDIQDPQELIMLFVKNDAVHGSMVELALQTYSEAHNSQTVQSAT